MTTSQKPTTVVWYSCTMPDRKKKIVVGLMVIVVTLIFLAIDRSFPPHTTESHKERAIETTLKRDKELPPEPFVYDGCSLFFDSLFGHDFSAGCLEHDIVYWAGGTPAERKAADQKLRHTIAETGPVGVLFQYPVYISVRTFGNSPVAQLFDVHWGFGWD